MATKPKVTDSSAFSGDNAQYQVSLDPTTGKEVLVTTPASSSAAAIQTYIYTDPSGNWRAESADQVLKSYMADIAATGSRKTISKQLYDNGYITQKQYTSDNAAGFLQGLTKYVMDYSVDQATALSSGQ